MKAVDAAVLSILLWVWHHRRFLLSTLCSRLSHHFGRV